MCGRRFRLGRWPSPHPGYLSIPVYACQVRTHIAPPHMPRVQRRARRAGRALGRSRAARVPALFAAEEDAWLECRIKWRDCSDRPIARRPASTSCIPADPLVQGICDAAVLVMLGSGSLAGQLPQAASPQPSCSDDSRYMHWLGLCGVARRPASTSCIPAAPLFRGLAT